MLLPCGHQRSTRLFSKKADLNFNYFFPEECGSSKGGMHPKLWCKEQMRETIIVEQLLQLFLADIRTLVWENEPEDGLAAAKLVMQYLNARKGALSQPIRVETRGYTCPRDSVPLTLEGNQGVNDKGHAPQSFTVTLVCHPCQQRGHKASVCILKRPKLARQCYVP